MMMYDLVSPLLIIFLIIVFGCLIGRLKFYNISLNLSAVLLISVVMGIIISASKIHDNGFFLEKLNTYTDVCSSIGTALFVSVIGLISGYSLKSGSKNDFIAFFISICMILSSVFVLFIIIYTDKNTSDSLLLGTFCGALTTTPGLSSLCESINIISGDAVVGYSCSYVFGVVLVVLSIQLFQSILKDNVNNFKPICYEHKNSFNFFDLIQISIIIVFGSLIGKIKLPFINLSLGNSGGMLFCGIILGYIIDKYAPAKKINSISLEVIRTLGLSLFFVGYGLPTGLEFVNTIEVKLILYGIILTIIPIAFGYWLCQSVFRKNNIDTLMVISGGMTSTPAMATVLEKRQNCMLNQYSFAYLGAIATTIIAIRIITNFL